MCFTIIPRKKKPTAEFAYKVLARPGLRSPHLYSPYFSDGSVWVVGETRTVDAGACRVGRKAAHGIYVYATLQAARRSLTAWHYAQRQRQHYAQHVVVRVKVLPQDFLFEGREDCGGGGARRTVRTYKKVIMDKVYSDQPK
jgi:hypothetical protein